VHSRDYRDIRRTLNSTPGPSRPHTMHITKCNTGIQRIWTDKEKSPYKVNRVPLTKNRLWAPFVAQNKAEYDVKNYADHGECYGLGG